MKAIFLFFIFLIPSFLLPSFCQTLKPGFDKAEYKEMMLLNVRTAKSRSYAAKFPQPSHFKMIYQSKGIGLDNSWDLWKNENGVIVVSVRGTTGETKSWLANGYAVMVPAKGELLLSKTDTFKYELANHPKAAVHVGWLICLAYLSKEILPKIDSCYKAGTREIILTGHSQGGGITFLLTAYLYHLQQQEKLPKDIRFKTYCSAGPKPGNLFFAYEYEAMTQNGWAYNVINSADWVPECPMSIQTSKDFNEINPFDDAGPLIKEQKFPKNVALKIIYKSVNRPTKKAQKSNEFYLGKMVGKYMKKFLPEFITPKYVHCSYYVRTGNTIILLADENYYKKFPNENDNLFCHHLHQQYLYLLEQYTQ